MKNVLLITVITVLLISCGGGSADSPKSVVNSFIEAGKKGGFDEMKKFITSQDIAMLEMAEKVIGNLDSLKKNAAKDRMADEFRKKAEHAKIEIKDEKIEGDNATVNVTFTRDEKTETLPFILKKEEGAWKISLMTTGMRASGMSQDQMDENMKKMREGMNEMSGAKDSIAQALKELKNINPDSLKKLMNSHSEEFEKLKEAAEKAGH